MGSILYPAIAGSPATSLAVVYTADVSTEIVVEDASILPAAPNMVTIRKGYEPNSQFCTVEYTIVTENTLSGLTLVEGTSELIFTPGSIVQRLYTAQDHNQFITAIKENIYGPATSRTDGLMAASDKDKLNGIEAGAQANVQSSWTETNVQSPKFITGKPALGTAAAKNISASGNAGLDQVVLGNDTRLTDARLAQSHAANHGLGGLDRIAIDASQITTGTIDLERIPHAALERLVIVDDDDARFALLEENVQNGDTVKVESTNHLYLVVNHELLDSESGYQVYTAGSAASVPWSGITEKPAAYVPDVHAVLHSVNGTDPITPVSIGAEPAITVLPISKGGTGAATGADARINLELGTAALRNVPASGDAGADEVVLGNDSRLSGTSSSGPHAATHAANGTDPLIAADIGVPTIIQMNSALSGKEASFTKNTAFNKNFETTASNLKVAGTAAVGTSVNVPRADHVHPAQTTVSGNAGTATTLATARTIALGTGATGTATSFNGSANITIPVTALNPTYLSAAVPVNKGGTGATTIDAALQNLYIPSFYLSHTKSGKDANGKYTIMESKVGTVLRYKYVLSGGTSPNYTTFTVTVYNTSGTSVATFTYALGYDGDTVISMTR